MNTVQSRETLIGAYIALEKADAARKFALDQLETIKNLCQKDGVDCTLYRDDLERLTRVHREEYGRLKGISQ